MRLREEMRKSNQDSIRKFIRVLITILSAIAIGLAAAGALSAQVMSGDKYSITSSVAASGGGTSSAGSKTIAGTAGQSATGGPYTGGAVSHYAGFWAAGPSSAMPTPSPSPTPVPVFGLSISDVGQVEGNN